VLDRLRRGPAGGATRRSGRWGGEGAPPRPRRGAERAAPPLEEPRRRASGPGGVPHRGPPPRPVIELVRFLPTIWEAGNIRLAYGTPAKRSCVRAAIRCDSSRSA